VRRGGGDGRCLVAEGVDTIARRRFQKKRPEETGKSLRINERIRKSPVRLIDENNEQVGIVDTEDARRRARAVNQDLVEVAPHSEPPVCRIMDYGKWKYQQRKKEQKAKAHAKQSELKEVRLRPGTDEHDLKIKTDRAKRFLEAGDKVQFTILFRGRQMAHREIGFDLFEQIKDHFKDMAHVEMPPKIQGRRMTMTMAHGGKSEKGSKGGDKSGQKDSGKKESAEKGSSDSESPQSQPSQSDANAGGGASDGSSAPQQEQPTETSSRS
jgi:translation initiation factor IF-3